jgi:membrane associated rhomboid family serine protease
MPRFDDAFLLKLLEACAACAPEPLYPARYAKENDLDRNKVDDGLDELRKRGLIQLTEWMKDFGQGRALTEAGKEALETGNLDAAPPPAPTHETSSFSTYQRGELVRDAIYEPKRAYVSWLLVAANVAYFLVGAVYAVSHDLSLKDYLRGDDDALLRTTTTVVVHLGGLFHPLVLADPRTSFFRPELERIILSCFLHFGLLHLGMNMFFLVSLGRLIESMWGRWRYLVIYLIAGIAGSCVALSYNLWQERNVLTAGASGSLCGLFASMVVWFSYNRQHMPDQLLNDWSRLLAFNIVILVGVSLMPNTSWQGHLGGAIGGALVGWLFQQERFNPLLQVRILALLGVLLVPIIFLAAVLWQAGWFSPLPM